MNILVIDAQGGGIGRLLASEIKKDWHIRFYSDAILPCYMDWRESNE